MKDYSGTLRKVLRRTQYNREDGKVIGRGRLFVLRESEDIILSDGYFLTVNDPTFIKSIGGEWFIKNYLKRDPIFYDVRVIDNSIQITGEEKQRAGVPELLKKTRKDLLVVSIGEYARHKEFSGYTEYINYIEKTFQDTRLEKFKDDFFLYFFDGKKVKGISK